MSKVIDLSKLFHAISAQDWAAANQLALKLADAEAARGNHVAASRLRGALKPNGHHNGAPGNGGAANLSAAIGILSQLPPIGGLEAVKLRPAQRGQLEGLVKEWREAKTTNAESAA